MTTEQIIKRSFLELNGAVLMILFSLCFNLPHYKTSNSRIFFPFQITPRKSNEINATPKSKVESMLVKTSRNFQCLCVRGCSSRCSCESSGQWFTNRGSYIQLMRPWCRETKIRFGSDPKKPIYCGCSAGSRSLLPSSHHCSATHTCLVLRYRHGIQFWKYSGVSCARNVRFQQKQK